MAHLYVPEFQCDCYLVNQLEIVVPSGPNTTGTPIQGWLLSRGRSLHHIAFQVGDLDAECARLRKASVPARPRSRSGRRRRPAGELHSSFLLRLSGRTGGDSVDLAGAPSPNRLPTGTAGSMRDAIDALIAAGEPRAAMGLLAELWEEESRPATASFIASRFERLRGQLPLRPCRVAFLRSFVIEPVIPLLRAMAFLGGIDLDVQIGSFNAYSQEILETNGVLSTPLIRTSSFSPRLQPMSLLIFGNVLQTLTQALSRKKSRQLRIPNGL